MGRLTLRDRQDIQITLEKPDGTKAEPPNKRSASFAKAPSRTPAGGDRAVSQSAKPQGPLGRRASSTVATQQQPQTQTISSTSPQPAKAVLTHNGKAGSAYPEIRTSKIDINANPIWPGTSKHITDLDIDADLAERTKPWRLPGTDQTDFFNYGFDEYTWTQYCIRQQSMAQGIAEQKRADEGLKAMLGGGGGGGGPPGPMPGMPGPGGPGGMPDMPPEMMQQMMAMMGQQQGMDPSQMDIGQMNRFMQGGGMGGGPGMGRGMGGGGSGQGASPMPQQGQGFQPPAGPGGGVGSGGFDPQALMAQGFSQQQVEMMRPPGQQGGGRGRGGRRGRGYY